MDSEPVTLTLTHDEALVLFEFLARNEGADSFPIVDQAEEKALWRLHGQLEKRLVEIFLPNYHELVQQARDRVRDPS
jgi:hypothetical protein